jgi:alkylation response protein AidB-like acyl-CoA dehydrogenase
VTRVEPLDLARELSAEWERTAAEHDRRATFPAEDVARLRQSGLLGLLVPERLGGMGANFHDYVRVAMCLARGSGASALLFNMHASVTGSLAGLPDGVAAELGVPHSFFAARDEILRRAAHGAMYGVAISERGAGSRLSAVQTTYVREGHGFRIRGHKSACSGAGHLDAYLVAARDGEAADDSPSPISYFLVPGDGIGKVEQTWDPLGMRATATNGFDLDTFVEEGALLGMEGVALLLAYAMPEWLVASYAAVYAGVARAAVDAAVLHVRDTTVLQPTTTGRSERVPLASSPWVRQRIGRADAQAEVARLAVEEAGRQVESAPGDPATRRSVYRAKLLAGDAAFDVAASVSEACGLGALARGSTLERLLRDARSGAVMPPGSDIAANVLGADALGVELGATLGERPW